MDDGTNVGAACVDGAEAEDGVAGTLQPVTREMQMW